MAMRVSREQVAENRQKILEAAGRLFRAKGFEAVTVAEVMRAAGLTHGGFYGHFGSKDDLIAQTLAYASWPGRIASDLRAEIDLARYAASYLSPRHRDDLAGGCPTAALGAETDPPVARGARGDDSGAAAADRAPERGRARRQRGREAPGRHRQLGGHGRRHDPRAGQRRSAALRRGAGRRHAPGSTANGRWVILVIWRSSPRTRGVHIELEGQATFTGWDNETDRKAYAAFEQGDAVCCPSPIWGDADHPDHR